MGDLVGVVVGLTLAGFGVAAWCDWPVPRYVAGGGWRRLYLSRRSSAAYALCGLLLAGQRLAFHAGAGIVAWLLLLGFVISLVVAVSGQGAEPEAAPRTHRPLA
jgi:hypothetical protein